MTEVERIRRAGWLSEYSFETEEKCDFLITEERKQIWVVLLDLLREFQRVCEKYDLTYYAICGTLLGTIRHKGFIPWDDDLDVAMPREDYEKLKKLKSEFSYPYNLVWPNVEQENGYSFLKLRNSETSAIPSALSHLNINQGIFLDIFPLDEADEKTYYEDQQTIKDLLIQNSNNMKKLKDAENKEQLKKNIVDTFNKIEESAQKDNGKDHKKIALRTISFYPPERLIWDKEDFMTCCAVPFEELNILIPIGWKKILETNYGDWKKMPPIEERGKWHANAIFDPMISYKKRYTETLKRGYKEF